MAAIFNQIKDTITSKITPDCLKAQADELKTKFEGETKLDPTNPEHKDKITEWEAGWNVTNAIQVWPQILFFKTSISTLGIISYTKLCKNPL